MNKTFASMVVAAVLLGSTAPVWAQEGSAHIELLEKSVVFLVCPLDGQIEIIPFERNPDGSRGKAWLENEIDTLEGYGGALVYAGYLGTYILSGNELIVHDYKGEILRAECEDETRWILAISERARQLLDDQ